MDDLNEIMTVDSGMHPVKVLQELVAASESAGIRLAMVGQGEYWEIVHGQVVLCGEPADERAWRYGRACFAERNVTGEQAAALLRGEARVLPELGPIMAGEALQQARFERCRSWQQRHPDRCQWPHVEWQVAKVGTDPEIEHELLTPAPDASSDAPDFATFEHAFSAFFFRRPPGPGGQHLPRWRVQRIDRTAYLDSIVIGPDELVAKVDGHAASTAVVRLTHPDRHQSLPVAPDGEVRFALPEGLRPATLLMVKVNGRWTDYRAFDHPDLRQDDPAVTWLRPGGDIAALIDGGEGAAVEFKREIAAKGADRLKPLKTIAAFASWHGGTVLFGVDDDATVVGLGAISLDDARLTITSMIQDNFGGVPTYDLEHAEIDGKTVIAVRVHADGGLYPLNPKNPTYYVRRGSSTVPMRADEIKARHQNEQPSR